MNEEASASGGLLVLNRMIAETNVHTPTGGTLGDFFSFTSLFCCVILALSTTWSRQSMLFATRKPIFPRIYMHKLIAYLLHKDF